ncbi:MAG: AbrB/MazE/SpoVT family DNA-binding domain-containing protein [Chloroflexi bacterium]|nr:MAG: AbrB/MazE/SpoVT family DNA-binding domain-containing protein [Chloroflexota bacterium]
MTTSSAKVSTRYRISIPQKIRRQLKIKSGDHLLVDVQNGMMILFPVGKKHTQSLAGLHHEIWEKSDEYMIGERTAWVDFSK